MLYGSPIPPPPLEFYKSRVIVPSGNSKLIQSSDKIFYLQASQDTKMCYKQTFASNSFLAGTSYICCTCLSTWCFVYTCNLMSLTGQLKWSTANKNMFHFTVSIPCDRIDILDLKMKEIMLLWQDWLPEETRLTLYTWFNFQILNIAAVSIVEAFFSKGDDKTQERTIYLVVIV